MKRTGACYFLFLLREREKETGRERERDQLQLDIMIVLPTAYHGNRQGKPVQKGKQGQNSTKTKRHSLVLFMSSCWCGHTWDLQFGNDGTLRLIPQITSGCSFELWTHLTGIRGAANCGLSQRCCRTSTLTVSLKAACFVYWYEKVPQMVRSSLALFSQRLRMCCSQIITSAREQRSFVCVYVWGIHHCPSSVRCHHLFFM